MQTQSYERDERDERDERNERNESGNEHEQERIRGRRRDKIWAKNVLLNTGLIVLSFWMVNLYVDTSPILYGMAKIFHFMESYMNFSRAVLCDMISFIVGIIFIIMFVLVTISIILLSCIPFLAFIFAFTSI